MARFYPNEQRGSAPTSEKRVFAALQKLSDGWVVVHSLRFVTPAHGRRPPRNGEADFVLLHPRHGLLVLEAKGGRYEIERGSWHTFPGGQRTPMDQSPFEQATQNRYDLQAHITDQTGLRGLPFGHAVAFTDGAPRGDLGPAAPRAIVIDGAELADLPAAIRRICAHWAPSRPRGLREDEFEKILSVLAPNASVIPDRRYTVDVAMVDIAQRTRRQIQFTAEQLAVIEATTPGTPVSVLGAAGTGKTVIAAHRAAELAARGRTVIFVADQRYLHGSLRHVPSLKHPNILLGTPAEVLEQLRPESVSLWEGFVEAADNGTPADAVIIDEAQSYDDDLLEAMAALCPDSWQMYADPYQRDSTGMWRPPGKPQTFWLTQNCRNSLPIAKLVARLGGSLSPSDGATGPPVRFIPASQDRGRQLVAVVAEMLTSLDPADIAILTCATDDAGKGARELRDALAVARVRVGRRPGDGGVTFLSSAEFRGCEASAVILIAGPDHQCQPATSATSHYVAASRAIVDLTVIGNEEDWTDCRHLMTRLPQEETG